MNSIIQTGQNGLAHSYQRMTQAAHNIATAATHADGGTLGVSSAGQTGAVAPANNASGAPATQSATRTESPDAVQPTNSIEESVLELRKQQQVFTASASVVSVGQELVGSLIDDYS